MFLHSKFHSLSSLLVLPLSLFEYLCTLLLVINTFLLQPHQHCITTHEKRIWKCNNHDHKSLIESNSRVAMSHTHHVFECFKKLQLLSDLIQRNRVCCQYQVRRCPENTNRHIPIIHPPVFLGTESIPHRRQLWDHTNHDIDSHSNNFCSI